MYTFLLKTCVFSLSFFLLDWQILILGVGTKKYVEHCLQKILNFGCFHWLLDVLYRGYGTRIQAKLLMLLKLIYRQGYSRTLNYIRFHLKCIVGCKEKGCMEREREKLDWLQVLWCINIQARLNELGFMVSGHIFDNFSFSHDLCIWMSILEIWNCINLNMFYAFLNMVLINCKPTKCK